MSAKPYPLTCYIKDVLGLFSDKYPSKVVSPYLLSCFVVAVENGKNRYYPIKSLRLVNEWHYSKSFEVHIDTYSYCQNPIDVKTSITALDILNLLERLQIKHIGESQLYCPELGRSIRYISVWSDDNDPLLPFLKEGILLFK